VHDARIDPPLNDPRQAMQTPKHWPDQFHSPAKAAGISHIVTHQGKYLKWQVIQPHKQSRTPGKRQAITEYTDASRFRLLSLMAKLDWAKATPSLFVTLTYPDEIVINDYRDTNKHRWVFWRYMEKHLQRHVTGLWRIEWKVRQTGRKINYIYPHFHLLVFGVQFIAWQELRQWWKDTIGHQDYVRTEVKALTSKGRYAAKAKTYAAKEDVSLVNATYLNSSPTGRAWGVFRKNELPLCAKITTILNECDLAKFGHALAMKDRPQINKYGNGSFTLLGERSDLIGKFIFGNALDIPRGIGDTTRVV